VSSIRLYSPSIVLALWAVLWVAGVRDDRLVGAALALVAVAVVVAELERVRR
jgi:hypothetical protein